MTAAERPPKPPDNPPPCICGPWTWTHNHWTFVINPKCTVHADG